MSLRTDTFDLGGLRLSSGEARRLDLNVAIDRFGLGGERYAVGPADPGGAPAAPDSGGAPAGLDSGGAPATPNPGAAPAALIPARLDVSRTTGEGYALRLRFDATLSGPCMRCLEAARPVFSVEAREVSQPGEGDELQSPYVEDGILDLRAWARDALALSLPATLLCRDDCAGLCATCGANLNEAGSGHSHERTPDPRWAKLSEIRFD